MDNTAVGTHANRRTIGVKSPEEDIPSSGPRNQDSHQDLRLSREEEVQRIDAVATQSKACKLSLRHPQRICITLPHHVFEALLQRSAEQGRSLSNLSAYLLELSLQHDTVREQLMAFSNVRQD
jgi:hypothetical protein